MPGRPQVGGLDGGRPRTPNRGRLQPRPNHRTAEANRLAARSVLRLMGAVAGRAASRGARRPISTDLFNYQGAKNVRMALADANPETSIPTSFREFDFLYEYPGMRISANSTTASHGPKKPQKERFSTRPPDLRGRDSLLAGRPQFAQSWDAARSFRPFHALRRAWTGDLIPGSAEALPQNLGLLFCFSLAVTAGESRMEKRNDFARLTPGSAYTDRTRHSKGTPKGSL